MKTKSSSSFIRQEHKHINEVIKAGATTLKYSTNSRH